ncbi:uncharacterized protein N0V89_002434 [Didymosphaeria variabile]|uniref:EamA domain-containing protein n=1 Tax=Didymosphaeria variabile TaxID=1932322 RepID=A0A9W8XUT2_9PLEO|nr:uncharacterized protein N0V89_002434 [Didymosphaeria variabile]KAJ4357857.1 hypothetical protein N0V89_002434 [Didymosphaeria variabile]
MRVPPPKAPVDDNDRTAKFVHSATEPEIEVSVKSGTKPEDALTVTFTGGIRAPSPNPSLLSVEDFGLLGRGADMGHGRRRTSRSPVPPAKTLREKLKAFWLENLGLILVLVSQLFGTLMNVTTRMLEVEGNNGKGYHPFQILFARMSITAVCSTWYMWWAKTKDFPFGIREVRWLLVARGLFGFFGVFGMYYSLLYLPLADATVITFLAPSLACWACSYLIHEPFTRMEQIAAYISLFGVVLIARPVTLFTSLHSNIDPVTPASGDADVEFIPTNGTDPSHRLASSYENVTPAQRASAVGIAMLGVIGAAGAYTTIRWIGRRAHPLISVNYFAMWCTLVSIVMMYVLPDVGFLLPQSWVDLSYLTFLGVCGFIMQFLLAAGLQYEKSSRATNMVYVQMLFALSFDKLVFGTTPSALSIVGSSLILGSAIYVATHKEDPNKNEDRRERASGEEETGLIDMEAEGERMSYDNDNEIQMRTLR